MCRGCSLARFFLCCCASITDWCGSLSVAWLIHEWTLNILSTIIHAEESLKLLQSCKMKILPLAVTLLYKRHSGWLMRSVSSATGGSSTSDCFFFFLCLYEQFNNTKLAWRCSTNYFYEIITLFYGMCCLQFMLKVIKTAFYWPEFIFCICIYVPSPLQNYVKPWTTFFNSKQKQESKFSLNHKNIKVQPVRKVWLHYIRSILIKQNVEFLIIFSQTSAFRILTFTMGTWADLLIF